MARLAYLDFAFIAAAVEEACTEFPECSACDDDPCCQNNDPCGLALDDICDRDSTCAWDAVDCE